MLHECTLLDDVINKLCKKAIYKLECIVLQVDVIVHMCCSLHRHFNIAQSNDAVEGLQTLLELLFAVVYIGEYQ